MIAQLAALAIFQATPSAPPTDVPWIAASGDDTTVATLIFDGGLSLSVLCRDERLLLLVGGLPAVPAGTESRVLQVASDAAPLRDSTWLVANDQTVGISTAPGYFARSLQYGGQFTFRVPPSGGPGRRYILPLPTDASALLAVLDACDVPRVDASDLNFDPTMANIFWDRLPTPIVPDGLAFTKARVVMSCIVLPDGKLDECRVEYEEPRARGFGRAALRSMKEARMKQLPGNAPEDRRVNFAINFTMQH